MTDFQTYRSPLGHTQESNYATPNNPLDSIRRSFTRGSYYSHLTATNTSTRSWVQNTQQNPPPPPEESVIEQSLSPPARPRPLPHPHAARPPTLHTINADPRDEESEDEEVYNGATSPPPVSGAHYGYSNYNVPVGDGVHYPRRMEASPIPLHAETGPMSDGSSKGNKWFVGGFVRGLRRLPRKLGYGATSEKRRFFRRGTLGGDEDRETTATLPRYQSDPPTPVAGPSHGQYMQDSSDMPTPRPPHAPPPPQVVGANAIPSNLLSGAALRRIQQPAFRVTPPSDVSQESSAAQIFQSPQPQFAQVVHPEHVLDNSGQRTTVMMYNETNGGDTSVADGPIVQRMPSRSQGTAPPTARHSARAPSVTIAPPPILPPPAPNPQYESEMVQSPETEHPLPTADYLKMNRYPASPTRSRGTMFSRTTGNSFYDPSFVSELSPVERFFKTLYNLPWVARGRVTIDYRPGDDEPGKKKGKGNVKKPMASWYRRFSRSSKELDLLSNGTPTPRTSSNVTSGGSRRSNRHRRSRSSTDLHKYYLHGHHQRRNHRRHRRHRNTVSTMTEEEEARRSPSPIIPAVYPFPYPTYPYTYPGFAAIPPAFATPPGQGTVLAPIPGSPNPMANGTPPGVVNVSAESAQQYQGAKRSPHGPRTRRSTRRGYGPPPTAYPHGGYGPYQPLAFPPPGAPPPPQIYVTMHGSPTPSNATPTPNVVNGAGDGGQPMMVDAATGQPQFYVPMHLVPGGWNGQTSSGSSPPNSIPRAPNSVSS